MSQPALYGRIPESPKPTGQMAHRRTLAIIVMPYKGKRCVHFCSTILQGNDTWHPIQDNSIFLTVERLMVEFGVAFNVTAVGHPRESGLATDYTVTYNIP